MPRTTTTRVPPKPAPPAPSGDPDLPTDVPTLQRQLKLCRALNASLSRDLSQVMRQAPMAPQDGAPDEVVALTMQHLRESLALKQLHYEQAQYEITQLKHALTFAHRVLGWQDVEPSWMLENDEAQDTDQVLRQLLALAHPDRWSQGQPASELAHELAIAINKHRESLERATTGTAQGFSMTKTQD